jgi:hypothetical protein
MKPSKKPLNEESKARIRDGFRREASAREKTYRERALKLFPHICARCTREFSGKRLRELTVHHKDGDHGNNPSDGSNWELLCVYCHDHEHDLLSAAAHSDGTAAGAVDETPAISRPFEGLKDLLKPGKEPPGSENDTEEDI